MPAHGVFAGRELLLCISATLTLLTVGGGTGLLEAEATDANAHNCELGGDGIVSLMQMQLGHRSLEQENDTAEAPASSANVTSEDASHARVVVDLQTSGKREFVADSDKLQPEYVRAESWTERVINEIHFEVHETPTTWPKKNKAVFGLLEAFFVPSVFGIDRCYMNQPIMGALKGLTLGGFGIWFFVDYVIFVVNALGKAEDIDRFGFQAHFGNGELQTAMLIAIVSLCVQLLSFMCCGNRVVKVSRVQNPKPADAQ